MRPRWLLGCTLFVAATSLSITPPTSPLVTASTASIMFKPSWAEQLFQLNGPGSRPATALQELSLVVDPGDVVAVCGSSGAGKTTVLKLCARRVDPSAGTLELQARPCWLDAGRVSELGNSLDRSRTLSAALAGLDLERTAHDALLNALTYSASADTVWAELDSVARVESTLILALATDLAQFERRTAELDPLLARPLILLDEVCDWRSPWAPISSQMALDTCIRRACRALQGAVLYTTHLASHARLADRVLHMNDGRALSLAPPGQSAWLRQQQW